VSLFSPSWSVCGAAALVVGAAAASGAWVLQGNLKDGEAAALRAQQLADAVATAKKNLAESERRIEAQGKADHEQAERDARERAAADAIAAAVNDRLLGDIARLERRAAADRTAAGKRTPAEALGTVLRDCQAKYRELERNATDDRSRGLACEARYDALIKP
jgi:hypothetical protein